MASRPKKSDNHNLSTIEEFQSVLNPIEEADKNDQDSSRQKINQDSTEQTMDLTQEEKKTIHVTRTVINTTGRIVPTINMGTNTMKVISKTFNDTPAKNEQYVSKNMKQT